MNILFIGDIHGKIGRLTVKKILPTIRKQEKIDFVIANPENSAHGTGSTEKIIKELIGAGVDFMTNGDHALKRVAQYKIFDQYPIIRPANYPKGAPGQGFSIVEVKGKNILITNLLGRVYMQMNYDCPFQKIDEILANPLLAKKNIFAIIIDIHGECSSEKIAMKHYLDGRVSALLGTHTHVMTADECVTKNGMAYITDAGMTGFADGCIGIEKDGVIKTFLTQIKQHHVVPEKGKGIFNSVLIKIDDTSGKAKSINRIVKFVNIK